MGTQMPQTKQMTINEFYSIHRPHGHPALDAGPKNSNLKKTKRVKLHSFHNTPLIINGFLWKERETANHTSSWTDTESAMKQVTQANFHNFTVGNQPVAVKDERDAPPMLKHRTTHTDNTKKRTWNLREECIFHHIKLTISSLHRPWRRETYYRKNIFYGCETTMKWVFFDSCLLSPERNLTCVNRDFSLLKKVVTKLKRDLRTRSRKYESMQPYV